MPPKVLPSQSPSTSYSSSLNRQLSPMGQVTMHCWVLVFNRTYYSCPLCRSLFFNWDAVLQPVGVSAFSLPTLRIAHIASAHRRRFSCY